jgi:hypothetical protein
MNRQAFLASAGSAMFACTSTALASSSDSDGRYGSIISPTLFSGVQGFLSPSVLSGSYLAVADAFAPGTSRVVLDNLPPVMAQGAGSRLGWPGTCESCSYGYGLGGYTASRDMRGPRSGWNGSDPHDQPSAAWLYQWVHRYSNVARSCPQGSLCVPYLQHLLRFGAPSAAQVPYNPGSAATVPALCEYIQSLDTAATFPGSERFIIGSYKGLHIHANRQTEYVALFTELVRNRHAISFSGLVPNGYVKPQLDRRGVYRATNGFVPKSGHGQVIVGYDDSLQAFLVQNSMSSTWNPGDANDVARNGRIWYSYDSFFAGQQVAALMFPRPPDAVPGITLETQTPNAPEIAVVNAIARSNGTKSYLLLVLRGTTPINVRSFAASDVGGTSRFATPINELMRLGYRYIEAPPRTFVPGHSYDVTMNVGLGLTYRGRVTLTT